MYLDKPPTREQLNRIITLLLQIPREDIKYIEDKYGIDFSYIPDYETASRLIAILEYVKERSGTNIR